MATLIDSEAREAVPPLLRSGDAVLGAELAPVVLGAIVCSPLEAVMEGLKAWAPNAEIASIRLIPSDSSPLTRPVLTARVYARRKAEGGDITLQVSVRASGADLVSAMVDLRFAGELS